MEGGIKQNIPLDSPIDVKSSDMLVPINQAKFLHNRQRFQGHTLPTSLRYEHDGYACGWDVWNFDVYEHEYWPLVSDEEAGPYHTQNEVSVIRYTNNSNPSYVLIFRKHVTNEMKVDMARIWFNTTSRIKTVVNGDPTAIHISRGQTPETAATTIIQGEYDGLPPYTVTINPVTGIKQVFPPEEWDLETVVLSNGTTDLTLINLSTMVNFHIDQFMFPSDIYLTSNLMIPFASFIAYTRNKGEHGYYTWRLNGDSKVNTIVKQEDVIQPDEEGSGTDTFNFTVTDDILVYDVDTDVLTHSMTMQRDYTSTVTGDLVTRTITINTTVTNKNITDRGRLDFVYYDKYNGNINIEFLHTIFYTAIRNMVVDKQDEALELGSAKSTWDNNPYNTEEEPYKFWYNWEYLQFMSKLGSTADNRIFARTVSTAGANSSYNDILLNKDESEYDIASMVNLPAYWEAKLDNKLIYYNSSNPQIPNIRYINGFLPIWFGIGVVADIDSSNRERQPELKLIDNVSAGYSANALRDSDGKGWTSREKGFFHSSGYACRMGECGNNAYVNLKLYDPKKAAGTDTPDDEFQIWNGSGTIYKPRVHIFEHDRCVYIAEYDKTTNTYIPVKLSDPDYYKPYSVLVDSSSGPPVNIDVYAVGVDTDMTRGRGADHWCRYAWFDNTSSRDESDTYTRPSRYTQPGFYRIMDDKKDRRVPRFPPYYYEYTHGGEEEQTESGVEPSLGGANVPSYAASIFYPDIVMSGWNCETSQDYSKYDTTKYTCPLDIAVANYKRGFAEISHSAYQTATANFKVWAKSSIEGRVTWELVACNYACVASDTPTMQSPYYLAMGTACRKRTFTIAGSRFDGVVSDLPNIAEFVQSWVTADISSRKGFARAATHINWYNPYASEKQFIGGVSSFTTTVSGGTSNNNMAKGMSFTIMKQDGFFRVNRTSGHNNYLTARDMLYETDYRKTAELGSARVRNPNGSYTYVPYTELYSGRKYAQNIVDKHIQEMHYRGSYAICVKGKYRFQAKLNDFIYPSGDYVRDENGNYKTYVDNSGTVKEIPVNPAYSFVFDTAAETESTGIYIDRNLTTTSAKDVGRGDGNRWEHQYVTLYDFTKYDEIRHTADWEILKEREETYGEYGSHSLFHLPYAEVENDSNPSLSDDDKLLSRDKDYTLHAYLTVPVTKDNRNKFPLFYHKTDSSLDSDADYRRRTRFFVPGHIWLGIDLYKPGVEGYDADLGYNTDVLDTGAGLSGYMISESIDLPREYNIEICVSGKAWQYYKVDPWTTDMLVAVMDSQGNIVVDENNNPVYVTEAVYSNVNSNWVLPNGIHPIYDVLRLLNRTIKFDMSPLNIIVQADGFISSGSSQTITMLMTCDTGTYRFPMTYTYDSVGAVVPVDQVSEFMTLVNPPTIIDHEYRLTISDVSSDVSGRTSFRPIFSYTDGGKNITTDNVMELLMQSNDLEYNGQAQLAACLNNGVIDADFEVLSYVNGTAELLKISDDENAVFNKGSSLLTVESRDSFGAPDYITVYDLYAVIDVQYNKKQRFNAVIYGPYKSKNIDIRAIDDQWMTTKLDIERFDLHKYYKTDITDNGVFTQDTHPNMRYLYTDVTDPDIIEHEVLHINPNEENQVLKQDSEYTNEIEGFWWIDDTHILKLNKHKFIVEVINEELDDWNANMHDTVKEYNRFEYLTGDVMQYGVTSAYKAAKAYFYTITEYKEHFNITFYDVLNDMQSFTIKAQTTKHSLGEKLIITRVGGSGEAKLNTYSDLTNGMVARGAKLSSTVIDTTILFGIHYDNNFNQWTLVIDTDSGRLTNVVQGYGFVSLKGVLTGGEIPNLFFNPEVGFTGTVQPLDYIEDKDGGKFKSQEITVTGILEQGIPGNFVVGNESQQWYLSSRIKGIVSHVVAYDETAPRPWTWRAETIDITNNYAAKYASPSFYTRTLSDYIPFAKGLASIFPISTSNSTIKKITKVLSKIASVLGAEIYGIYPKINTAGYLQQALGQYAYVHYNSLNNYIKKDEVSKVNDNPYARDELSFNTMTISQKATIKNSWGFFMGLLGQFSISACDMAIESLSANSHQNQTDTGTKGDKYTDSFLRNIDAMASTEMTVQSATPTLNSKVVGSMTLDMFYSTSEQQKVYAGPGFVNHNFVAQCIAQSVTSKHFELNQIGILLILKSATMFQIEKTIFIEETIIEFTQYYANAFSNQTIAIPFGGATNVVSNIAALVMMIANKAAKIALAITKFVQKYVPDLIDSIGANRMQVNVLARQSSHTYDIEGKHRYGSRSECFMYPCVTDFEYVIPSEYVEAVKVNNPWSIDIDQWSDSATGKTKLLSGKSTTINCVTDEPPKAVTRDWEDTTADEREGRGSVPFYSINCKGKSEDIQLPQGMAYVIGTESFLPKQPFKNQNISESEPVFATPVIQDYVIDDDWGLYMTATAGEIAWVSCKDTKIIDGAPTNIFVNNNFCGVASAYAALQIRDTVDKRFVRPYAITPNAIALNQTGYNCCYDRKVYHAFDGYGYRLTNWIGAPGMGTERQVLQYSFIANDRFKRSNKLPPNQFMGNFKSAPEVNIRGDHNDKIYSAISIPGEVDSLIAGTEGEDKDVIRYAIPVFSELVNTLPAAVKTNAAYTLAVVDGITSLCTDLRNVQFAYKSPRSVDFNIGGALYRYTSEYICALREEQGTIVAENLVPVLGLSFIGATPYEAYFYSQATRQYYVFRGGTKLDAVDMIERFRDVTDGKYDFVNQEVVVPCLATFDRLDDDVHDYDSEIDNVIVPVLKQQEFVYELSPPIDTIFNDRSWYKTLSIPAGIVYQGPNRCIINRYVISDYMYKSLKKNAGHWEKVPREDYHPMRKYNAKYETVDEQIGFDVNVNGWTHNPFLLVTSPLGVSENVDCMYEWEITFAWTVEMDRIYEADNYICVNVSAETMTPGGKVICRPTHIFLTKELFTRSGNYGYYSFRFQSRNGAGNRERLHVWSDGYIAISGIQCEYKPVTERRTEILTQQLDVQKLKEF